MWQYLKRLPFLNYLIRKFTVRLNAWLNVLENRVWIQGWVQVEKDQYTFRAYGRGDDSLLTSLWYQQIRLETQEIALVAILSESSALSLDIGAFTGLFSLMMAAANPESEIIAFEPNPVNFRRLEKNIKGNKFSKLKALPLALGKEEKKITFTIPQKEIICNTSSALESFARSTYSESLEWRNIEVKQSSVDQFCQAQNLGKIGFLKIDVEGYEAQVLEGARSIITQDKPHIFLENLGGEKNKDFLINFAKEYDYHIYLPLLEGIVHLGKNLEGKVGLNYILLSFQTSGAFTSYANLRKELKSI